MTDLENTWLAFEKNGIWKVLEYCHIFRYYDHPPKGCTLERWHQICFDFRSSFIGSGAILDALDKRWTLEQLVGVHPKAMGVLFHLKGRDVTGVTRKYMSCDWGPDIRPGNVYRMPMPKGTKLIWDYYNEQQKK